MSKRKKRQGERKGAVRNRADPIAIWLNGGEMRETLCPKGYTPMSKNQEVRRCIYKIADLVSNMTIMLMQNGENGDVRIKNELSKKIDIYPSQNMTRKNFIMRIVTDMYLGGNAVVVPQIQESWIDNLKILQWDSLTFNEEGDGYRIRCRGAEFKPDEVLHFVLNPDDDDPFRGAGYTNMIRQTVENIVQANITKTAFLQSEWKPSMIISVDADIGELQDVDKRNNILNSYTKTKAIGEPWLIPSGEMHVEQIKPLTLNDLSIVDGITLDMKSIAAAFGIPPFMLGVGDFNKEAYNNFVATRIMSDAINIQQELSKKLLYSPGMYFKFNPKSLMQYSLPEQVGFVKELVAGGMMNRNEGRAEFDYAPANKEGMNDYIVLENYVPVDRVGDQKKLKQKGEDGNE